MTWSIFRSKNQRTVTPHARNRPEKPPTSPLLASLNNNSGPSSLRKHSGRNGSTNSVLKTSSRPLLDPESNPLSGVASVAPPQPVSYQKQPQHAPPSQPQHTNPKRSSFHSTRSISGRSESIRSMKSGGASMRARQIRAAHAAKRAATQYIAENSQKHLTCYTCGHQISDVRCSICRTAYLPPQYQYNASSAAMFSGGDSLGGNVGGTVFSNNDNWVDMNDPIAPIGGSAKVGPSSASVSNVSISGVSLSGVSISGAASFIGFYPESEEEFVDVRSGLDLELINDLAHLNESALLEAVLFEGFSNVESVADAFYRPISTETSDDASHASYSDAPENINVSEDPLNQSTRIGDPSTSPSKQTIVDNVAVRRLYDLLASVSSTAPMRGILHGAQCVLQTRKHAPITEKELAYICVILQCPAITDCSMFTKIMGPLQKLSRYASLRSRARTILEVCAGLVVHANEELHPLFSNVFAALDQSHLADIVDLCNAYVSHRLSFDFHFVSRTTLTRSKFQLVKHDWYSEDWRLSVVVRLMALLWTSNKIRSTDKTISCLPAHRFYNTMVDLVDLKADFDSWQVGKSRKPPRFCFCRYPFLLSMGSKAVVFEHSIQRVVNGTIQREVFAVIANNRRMGTLESQQMELSSLRTFTLRVRRQHLLKDSIKKLKEWPNYQRRAFKVEFEGEPGIDAGGLKKEWFYLFYKQLFDPELEVFKMDETSNYCWFGDNPDPVYYSVAGTALGLALFNSVTIDLNLPLLLFKLLLDFPYDLNDIGKLWPDIAQSLQNILDYEEDDFEEIFGLTFVAPDGTHLLANGDTMNVTLSSKELYVNLLVEHLVNTQGTPYQMFKSAFLDVCGGNALTLFQPEELELLTRGDRQPIDVQALRSVTKYVNFGHRYEKANVEPIVIWFWDFFAKLDPTSQARLLQFVTATDRPPAAGMVQMRFSIMCLGGDSDRLPIAHTCFNQLCLYKYKSRKKLEQKLSLAIVEYQGFGLK